MVRQNDYALGLFNGDVGICLPTPHGLRVFFEGEDGHRPFSPARLPSHDSAFAMTVHKSQGSEFREVLLVLPEQPSPLLSRSLFYTGITRARQRVEIWGLPQRLAEAVSTRAERAAGLAERLAREPQPAAPPQPHPLRRHRLYRCRRPGGSWICSRGWRGGLKPTLRPLRRTLLLGGNENGARGPRCHDAVDQSIRRTLARTIFGPFIFLTMMRRPSVSSTSSSSGTRLRLS